MIKHVMLSPKAKRATYCGLVLERERVPFHARALVAAGALKYAKRCCKRCLAAVQRETRS